MKNGSLLKQKHTLNRNFLIFILMMVMVGLIAIADVSAPQSLNMFNDKFYLFKQQAVWALIGFGALFVSSQIKYTFWEKIATPLFLLSVILLLVVLLPHVGFSTLGARRWIVAGPINFQPSEIVKFTLVIYLAKVASRKKSSLSYFLPMIIIGGLIMLQPDLGTTLVVMIIGISQIFVSEVNMLYFLGFVAAGVIGGIPIILLSPYRKERLLTFLQMAQDPLDSSYHIRQVLLALGSGGIFGVGLGASKQKFLFLPEASNDSIFAVIAEEVGLIGSVVIIGMFAYFVMKALNIAKTAPDTFSKVLCVGIAAWIGGQAFLNIASMVALVPLTGIPLPFISYGGSSLVMILTACGILLNVTRYAVVTENERPRRRKI